MTSSTHRSRVLVTGATGQCGSAIARRLDRSDRFDLLTTSRRECGRLGHVRLDLCSMTGDGASPHLLGDLDAVVHCAALVDERAGFEVIECNLRMTFGALALARAAGAGHFVLLSSVAVYGDAGGRSQLDEDQPLAPSTPYGISKCLSETLVEETSGHPIKMSVLRLSYVLSTSMPQRYFLHRLLKQLQVGAPVELVNPDVTRFNFVNADEVGECVERVLDRSIDGTFNVAGDRPVSLREVFQAIRHHAPTSQSEVIEVSDPTAPVNPTYDSARIKDATGIRHFADGLDLLRGGGW